VIDGLVKNKKEYSYREVIDSFTNYKKIVTINCVEGWSVTILWKGILIKDLLEIAEPDESTKVIIFHAHDEYTTSFPIEYFLENDIIMAHTMNGITIPPERGFPFQLVAEAKWGYKWIRWITRIELSDDVEYRGFWERRGYNQEGNVSDPIFEE
jgi:DMSO/TMAO reductase YedYZ molybdopterin-dependent catalytic subunit